MSLQRRNLILKSVTKGLFMTSVFVASYWTIALQESTKNFSVPHQRRIRDVFFWETFYGTYALLYISSACSVIGWLCDLSQKVKLFHHWRGNTPNSTGALADMQSRLSTTGTDGKVKVRGQVYKYTDTRTHTRMHTRAHTCSAVRCTLYHAEMKTLTCADRRGAEYDKVKYLAT